MKNSMNRIHSKNRLMQFIMILVISISQIACNSNTKRGANAIGQEQQLSQTKNKLITVAEKNGIAVKINDASISEIKNVTDEVTNFLSERGYSVIESTNKSTDLHTSLTLTTEENLKNTSLSKSLLKEISDFFNSSRDEAYILYVSKNTEQANIFLVGKTVSGLRAAVERFRGKISNDGSSLKIESGIEMNTPFIAGRLINIGDSPRRQTPLNSPFEDAGVEVWPEEKLSAYPELFRQFGLNGIQIGECKGYGSIKGKKLEQARKAAIALAKGAKKSKMTLSWFIWGDAVIDEFEVLCWNDPKERKVIENSHRAEVELFGEYVDHINVHIADPGGCTRNGCDAYKTRQQIANYIIREFRKINPKIEGTFSTWANGEFWLHAPEPVGLENYFSVFLPPPDKIKFNEPIPDGAKFLDDTFLSKDIGIALNRFYQPDQAKYVIESGRPLDIWGWYISDYEMKNNMAFNMTNIDKYFQDIPPEAGEQIRYYNAELNFHGWPQIINVYVVAQKMWNPKRSLNDIEMEFCTATFGAEYAATMVDVYNAAEGGYSAMIPNPPDFGTSDYNKHLHNILENAQKVNIPNNWKPNFDFPVPVTKYVDMLVARLRLILAVSEAKEQIVKVRASLNTSITSAAVKSLVFQVVDANGSSIASAPFSPNAIKLEPGHSIGQTFHAIRDFSKIGIQVPTWHKTNAGLTLSLYDKIGGKLMAKSKFTNIVDGSWIWLESESRILSGNYYLELSNPTGDLVGVYGSLDKAQPDALVYFDREPAGDEDEGIKKIKQNAIKNLPNLPIDPIYNQDETIVLPAYKTRTFKEMIEQL